MCSRCGPVDCVFGFLSVFHPWLKKSLASLLSGTNVRSVAQERARAGSAQFLARGKVRPLTSDLPVGNLLPASSSISAQGSLSTNGKTTESLRLMPEAGLAHHLGFR